VRAARPLSTGTTLSRDDVDVLRPASADAVPAHEVGLVVGRTLIRDLVFGEQVNWDDLAPQG
jgi:sialic acid synthase SpsE